MNITLFQLNGGTILKTHYNLLCKKIISLLIISFTLTIGRAQVGINNTDPKANLDISASNVSTPTATDGILIPRINNFPVSNPTIEQEGMMVFATGNGTPSKGFYYWNQNTESWVAVGSETDTQNTLNQAYDEGGAGAGKNINATDGAVRINGDDGFLVTGTFGTGNTIDTEITGAGTKMFFNPRKAAFRAGGVSGAQWNNANVGNYSFAANQNTTASGVSSFALGNGTIASGVNSFAQGIVSTASGTAAASFGNSTASGNTSFATGQTTTASGTNSATFGRNTVAPSYVEVAIGSFPRVYAAIDATAFNSSDRAFVIGNGTGVGTQSHNALEVWKNGRVEINEAYSFPLADGTTGQLLGTDGSGTLSWSSPSFGSTLDQAYDFGGAGSGRIINATDGAVNIGGEDGLLVTGTFGSGDAVAVSGTGTRFFFNPRKAAFRAGRITGTQWDNANIGNYSASFGIDNTASADGSVAFGNGNTVSGLNAISFGNSNNASGLASAVFGEQNDSSGAFSVAMGTLATASGESALAVGQNVSAVGDASIAMGGDSSATRGSSVAIGNNVTSYSRYETVMGTNSTIYTPDAPNGFDGDDRLFVIGNGASPALRSNALTILKNGSMNINDAYTLPTIDGASGQFMQTDGAGSVSWANPSNSLTFENGIVETSGIVALGGTLTQNTTIQANNFNTILDLNGTGDFSIQDNGNNAFVILDNGNVGIGKSPSLKLDVLGGGNVANIQASGSTGHILSIRHTAADPSTSNGYIRFYRSNNFETGAITPTSTSNGVLYTSASDRRLKMNIEDITDALALIGKIDARIYEYKNSPGKREYGFIAQELQKVYPQAVAGSPNSDAFTKPMTVDYSRLTPILTAGIQELWKEITILKEKNALLEAMLAKYEMLESRLTELEANK